MKRFQFRERAEEMREDTLAMREYRRPLNNRLSDLDPSLSLSASQSMRNFKRENVRSHKFVNPVLVLET